MESMGSKPRRRRSFTPEFKAEIVELCQRGDRSVGQVARDFDLTETAVREWVRQAERDAGTRRDGGGRSSCGPRRRGSWRWTSSPPTLLNGTKVYVLAAIEHGTRRIRILGATEHPVQSWVVQQARNLLMDLEDAGTRAKFVLHDRDASFTATFDAVFQAAGATIVRSAIQAPRMNSIIERWIGSCRRELLDRTLIWNQRHLMTVLREYEGFHNTRRPHAP